MKHDVITELEQSITESIKKAIPFHIDNMVKHIQDLLPDDRYSVDIVDDIGYVILFNGSMYLGTEVYTPINELQDFLLELYGLLYGETIFEFLPKTINKTSVVNNSQHIESKYTPLEQMLYNKIAMLESQNGRLHHSLSAAREALADIESSEP